MAELLRTNFGANYSLAGFLPIDCGLFSGRCLEPAAPGFQTRTQSKGDTLALEAHAAARGKTSARSRAVPVRRPLSRRELITNLSQNVDRIIASPVAYWVLVGLLTASIISSLVWAVSMAQHLEDLGSFLHSGVAYRHGLDPYGYYGWLRPQPISANALNLNPPVSVYAFALLTHVNSEVVRWGFLVGNTLVFCAVVGLLTTAYPEKRSFVAVLALFCTAGLWHMLGYLQIYAPLLLLVTASWLSMRRGDLLLAGIAAGIVVAIKPNFVLWPVFLLAAGHRRSGVAALATFAALSLIPLAVDGPAMYRSWFHLTSSFAGIQWASNTSIASMTARFGSQSLGFALAIGLIGWLAWWLHQTRADVHTATTLGIIAALLFGPASWAGYTLFLLPFLFSRTWNRPIWVALLMLAVPFWLVRSATGAGSIWDPILGPLYAWAMLLLLGTILYEQGVRICLTSRQRDLLARLGGRLSELLLEPAPVPAQLQVEVDERERNRQVWN